MTHHWHDVRVDGTTPSRTVTVGRHLDSGAEASHGSQSLGDKLLALFPLSPSLLPFLSPPLLFFLAPFLAWSPGEGPAGRESRSELTNC